MREMTANRESLSCHGRGNTQTHRIEVLERERSLIQQKRATLLSKMNRGSLFSHSAEDGSSQTKSIYLMSLFKGHSHHYLYK